jgi:hypothetical protein
MSKLQDFLDEFSFPHMHHVDIYYPLIKLCLFK